MKQLLLLSILFGSINILSAQTKAKVKSTKAKLSTTTTAAVSGKLSVPQSNKPKVNPNLPTIAPPSVYDEIVVSGRVVNCMGEELTAVQVVLYSAGGKTKLATTLTDMMGQYTINAKGWPSYAVQVVFGGDSSQIVSELIPQGHNGINLDFMSRNLPQEFLFPAVSAMGNEMLKPKDRASRNEMKKTMNGDSTLNATLPNVRIADFVSPMRIASINKRKGIFYETRSNTFVEQDGFQQSAEPPILPPTNIQIPGGNR
jgi:hypothetical protein